MTSTQRKLRKQRNAILMNVFIGALMGIAASFALFLPLVLQ
jgi:hypothetical protein